MSNIAAVNIALESFAMVISLIMIISLLLNNTNNTRLNKLFIWALAINGIVLLSDMINWCMEGSSSAYAHQISWVANLCVITLCLPETAIYNDYLVTYISTKANVSRKIINVMYVLYGVFLIATFVAQLNGMCFYIDENNYYCRGSLFWLPYVMPSVGMLFAFILIIRYRRKLGIKDSITFLSNIVIPAIAIIIQFNFYSILTIYVVSIVALLIIYVRIQLEQSRLLTQKELELANSRIDIMLSQIQPHFLYNTLNAIENLCIKDGKQAAEMVNNFAVYLRENMDSLSQKELVRFERELSHVKTYLEIEKKRFGERLHAFYDLETTDFALPTLTVQPIVENAVCHGVLEKKEGGTVTIATRIIPEGVQIIVTDDGVGYNVTENMSVDRQNRSKRSHVALENVKSRLSAQCGGTINVESTIGVGTRVTIAIPNARREK